MPIRITSPFLALLALPLAAGPVFSQDGPFAIRDVRVFDGDAVLTEATVVIEDGRVAAVGPSTEVAARGRTIDGAGRTLLPGLIDAHTHTFDPSALRQAAVLGVTTQLDMVNDADFAARMRSEPGGGADPARADLLSSGPPITAPGGHGTQFGMRFEPVDSPDEAKRRVAEYAADGADWIKIIREDGSAFGIDFPAISAETLGAAVEAAHDRDLLAVVHPGSFDIARDAIERGADGLVHVPVDRMPADDFGRFVASRGAFVIPTLTVFESTEGTAALAADPRIAPSLGVDERAGMSSGAEWKAAIRFDGAMAAVGQLHRSGARILVGSDAPNPGTTYGASVHRELELLVEAGLTPLEALRSATSATADAFGLDDRGRIAVGRVADLLLVEGDPTADVSDSRRIVAVWKGGRQIDREAFRASVEQELAAGRAAPAPNIEDGAISDFDGGSAEARFGAGWMASTDSFMGGESTAELTVVEGGAAGSPGALEIEGTVRAGFPFPFAGAMFSPGSGPMAPTDLSAWDGVAFQARGDGRTYRILVFSPSLGQVPRQRTFEAGPEWASRHFAWADFGIDGSDVQAIWFGGGPEPGDFALRIDEVRLE